MSNVLLISYDNGSHLPVFPMNLFYLAGALEKVGHVVGIWFQDIHHESDKTLNKFLDEGFFNVVGLGFVAGYYPYRKAKALSEIINKHKNRKKITYVLGGHGPAGAPEFFLEKMGADTVVVGDGEDAICDIADDRACGMIWANPVNADFSPLESYRMFPIDVYRLNRCPTATRTDFCMPILSSRGCTFQCSFCYRMRDGFYERSIKAIVQEIKFLHKHYFINHFDFEDELLMSSEKRTAEICDAILGLPFKIKWDCNGRLNYAKKPLLKLMKQSGCEYVNYGIESLNQKILNQMGKGLTLDRIYQGVEDTLACGLSPGLNFLWGFPLNVEQDLFDEVDFLLKYDPCHELRTIRPVTPYPGCRLYDEAIEKGLIENAEDFYESKHQNSDLISVNFMDIPTKKAHEMLFRANNQLISNYMKKRKQGMISNSVELYIQGNSNFRGWRAV